MYQSKLVASLKANGKILREFKDTVYIPFGSEYSILIKNLNTARACVNIFLDGENVVPGGLVINPGQEIDLERWIKNGNLKAGNKFKFIERTQAIEDGPRGVKLEDGLIRIEFQYEQARPVFNVSSIAGSGFLNYPPGVRGMTSEYPGVVDKFSAGSPSTWIQSSGATYSTNVGGAMRGVDFSKGESVKATAAAAINQVAPQSSELHDGMATMDSYNDVGITVPGSRSDQSFTHVTMGVMEAEKHTMVLRLLGETPDNKPVLQPVTVKAKPKCVTCGTQNKAHAKFCNKCGTSLEIFA